MYILFGQWNSYRFWLWFFYRYDFNQVTESFWYCKPRWLNNAKQKQKQKKWDSIGFSEEKTKWFNSYLSNRKFKAPIMHTFSGPGILLCRVLQRPILGPLLFLLCINDMPRVIDCELLLYADDNQFCFSVNIKLRIQNQ